MQAAGVTADWKDPRLARYASGEALHTLVTGLDDARKQGIAIKGTIVTHPHAVSVTPAAAVLMPVAESRAIVTGSIP